MDHGALTDNNGRKADFRNVIIVMTTNAGAQEIKPKLDRLHDPGPLVRRHGSDKADVLAEFRNRLDAIHPVQGAVARDGAARRGQVPVRAGGQLHAKNVTLEVDGEAKLWLAERGFDPLMGARPMARLIQESFKKPLAEQLLFGQLAEGGHVRVSVRDGELAFDIESRVVH